MSSSIPETPVEVRHVCRAHDRLLKEQTVRSRPRKPDELAPPQPPAVVRCGGCGRVLDERPDVAYGQRLPCPACGSTLRATEVQAEDRLSLHDAVRARVKRPGKSGYQLDTRAGDDYSRDLDAWGTRELTLDREHDVYREVIALWDGTRIESTAL